MNKFMYSVLTWSKDIVHSSIRYTKNILGKVNTSTPTIAQDTIDRVVDIFKSGERSVGGAYERASAELAKLIAERDIAVIACMDLMPSAYMKYKQWCRKIEKLQTEIDKIQLEIKKIFGTTPNTSLLHDGRMVWKSNIKEAAYQVVNEYKRDAKSDPRNYASLKDASDEFFNKHFFIKKPRLTRKKFYDNVKKIR